MNDYLKNLAERAVKAKGWQWMRGMTAKSPHDGVGGIWTMRSNKLSDGWRRYWRDRDSKCICETTEEAWYADAMGILPDFSDAATVGCLPTLVRKKHGPEVYCCPTPMTSIWRAFRSPSELLPFGLGATEVEALVEALEAE